MNCSIFSSSSSSVKSVSLSTALTLYRRLDEEGFVQEGCQAERHQVKDTFVYGLRPSDCTAFQAHVCMSAIAFVLCYRGDPTRSAQC